MRWLAALWAWLTAVEPSYATVQGGSRDRSLHGKDRLPSPTGGPSMKPAFAFLAGVVLATVAPFAGALLGAVLSERNERREGFGVTLKGWE